MNPSVLVMGFSTRHVAQSAHAAGYMVYAVDHFCDQDLSWYTKDRIRFEDLAELAPAVEEMCRRHPVDFVIPTSGAELLPSEVPVLGTSPAKAARFMDKLLTQEFFESLGVPAPRLLAGGQYPAMIKPRNGSGGWRNRVVRSSAEEERWHAEFENIPFILQEIVSGVAASVCCLSDGRGGARAVAANLQILRGEGEFCYGFAGSLTPLDHPLTPEIMRVAERIAAASGCQGTLGVDFVLGESPYAIEVNPRFQATLDTVERATGINLFSAHVKASRGILPGECRPPRLFSLRRILFAERDCVVRDDLSRLFPAVSDIPWPGSTFEEGQAIVSVQAWGKNLVEATGALDTHIRRVRQYIE
ncbi:MAG: ATP-grasp domain-containing protein [Methanolinea sp.]|nr:ATP-grasp domain-containing protein [Methanolinea sp.]